MSDNRNSMNQTIWSGHYFSDHIIMSTLIGVLGLTAGWILGSAAVVVIAHVPASVLHAAGGWAWAAIRAGSPVIPTTPVALGYGPAALSMIMMITGAVVGWRIEDRPNETHKRGYQVAEDASGIARALGGADDGDSGILVHPAARMSQAQECRHIMILGGSGSGKTTILWPIIQQIIERGDRCLIYDYKGDFTIGLGNATILSPWDARSAAWQVGADVRTRIDAETLAATLVPAPDKGDQIWAHGAQGLLTAMISRLQRQRGAKWGLEHLAQTVYAALADYDYLMDVVERESPTAKVFLSGADSKMTASFLAELSSNLTQTISLGVGQDAIKRGEIWSARAWIAGRTPRAAILGYLPSAPVLSRAWCTSVIEQVVRTLSDLPNCAPDDEKRRTWLVLDEVPQAGKIPSITNAIETLRSKCVRVIVGAQSIAQIKEVYGRETATIWASSTATKIIAQTSAPDDQKWASDLLGDREIERYQRQVSRSSANSSEAHTTESWTPARERVMMPSDFGRTLYVTSTGPRALAVAGGEAAILCWPWPTLTSVRDPRIEARWMRADYQRPDWGTVPPPVSTPTPDTHAPRPVTAPVVPIPRVPRLQMLDPARARLAAEQTPQGERQADKGAGAAVDAVIDPVVGAALDAVIPGLGTALDLTQVVTDVAARGGEGKAEFPPAPIVIGEEVIEEQEVESEIDIDRD